MLNSELFSQCILIAILRKNTHLLENDACTILRGTTRKTRSTSEPKTNEEEADCCSVVAAAAAAASRHQGRNTAKYNDITLGRRFRRESVVNLLHI